MTHTWRSGLRMVLLTWLGASLSISAIMLALSKAPEFADVCGLLMVSCMLGALLAPIIAPVVYLIVSRHGTLGQRFTSAPIVLTFLYVNLALGLVACMACQGWPRPWLWQLPMGLGLALGLLLPVLKPSLVGRNGLPDSLNSALILMAVTFMLWVLSVAEGTRVLLLALAGERAVGLSPAEAPHHPRAVGFEFAQGRGRREFAGVAEHVKSDSTDRWYAVPFVADDWTADQPVTVWAVDFDGIDDKLTQGRFRAGFVHDPHETSMTYLRQAVEDAQARHGVRSHPQAVYLDMGESLDSFTGKGIFFLVIGLLAPNGIWAVAVLRAQAAQFPPGSAAA